MFNNILDIINTDAITIKDHYFFATHKPFDNLKFSKTGSDTGNEFDVSEEDLFNKYILDILKDHSFTIIKGDNGTGKSHFIKWLNYKLKKDINNREIVFIKRHEATLKSTIRQLGDLEVVKKNDELNKKINSFLKGKKTTDIEKLKDLLISHIATEIEHDDDEFFNKPHRNRLYAFLHNKFIKEHLLKKENGFIDRICKRLIGESEFRLDDVPVEISHNDLTIDLDFLKKMKKENSDDLNNSVRKIALKLEKRETYVDDIVRYIDSVIDEAIQMTVDFNADNMMELLSEIRREIKKDNKKLVLLIEDITAFPGLEKALREALILDHKKDDTLCQVNSFVGVTTAYYSKNFIGNEKDRVTEKIIIDNDSIFSTKEDKFDFVSRYLNAMLLSEKEILKWFNNGMVNEALPKYYKINKDEFPKWSIYDDEYLLFPFNEIAIIRLYNSLKEYERTPRVFLKEILKPLIMAFEKFPNNFPPSLESFQKNNIKIEKWSDSHMNDIIKKLLKNQEQLKSFNTFLLLYSDRSISVQEKDGQKKYAGLSKEVFETFDFSINYSAFTKAIKKEKRKKKIKEKIKVVDEKKNKIKNLKNLINNWYNKEKNYRFRQIREQLVKIIPYIIDYKKIKLNRNQLEEQLTLGKLYFESDNSKSDEQIIIKRSQKAQYLMEAIANYIYQGDKSWNYERSDIDFNILINYTEEKIYPQIQEKFESYDNDSLVKILAFNLLESYLSDPKFLDKPVDKLYLEVISIDEYKNINKIYSLDKNNKLEKIEFNKEELLIAMEDYSDVIGNVSIIKSKNIVFNIAYIFELINELVSNFQDREIKYIKDILSFLKEYNKKMNKEINNFNKYTNGINIFSEIIEFYDLLSEYNKVYDSRYKKFFQKLENNDIYNKIIKELESYDFKNNGIINYRNIVNLECYEFQEINDKLMEVNKFIIKLNKEINKNIDSTKKGDNSYKNKLFKKINSDITSIEKVI